MKTYTLTRPQYQYAENFSAWVHKNSDALARYFCECDEAIRRSGGCAPGLDEWEWFAKSQYDSFMQSRLNNQGWLGDAELWNTAQRTKDFEKDVALAGLGSVWDKYD